mmetsp:Transcript_28552/g.37374  ORF Transcript_28552/g.37374 Transcript_28552/m.37374 type:complete len:163 (+) Transcript_28552:66-554(+)|eukprot:CAMPEP_0117798574 /NCGR_PEP_ID=MMETSP0948-20121206/13233_1 /TAXON_ID=44440 /ORGANISM="Chattonella subsalsa, Strain CCMP2191" /LENGTH=162 /DNA_ID=CAMNT_0005630243 /DNA_START=50 /DNA_END=538 /DNA_ORIENTATION=-
MALTTRSISLLKAVSNQIFGNYFLNRLSTQAAPLAHTVVRHPIPDAILPEGVSREDRFAVVKLGGTQYKVTKDDVVVAEKIKDAEIGTYIENDKVLLVGSVDETVVGKPFVPDAKVKFFVEEQTQDKKVIVFKMRRRKNSKRKNGHRRQVTLLRVADIITNV